jgi:hypothetical protein
LRGGAGRLQLLGSTSLAQAQQDPSLAAQHDKRGAQGNRNLGAIRDPSVNDEGLGYVIGLPLNHSKVRKFGAKNCSILQAIRPKKNENLGFLIGTLQQN